MKTKNNVQKAILKSMAVVVSLVLISFTVSAQDFWESLLENTTFNEIALAMVESNSGTNEASADANTSSDASAHAALLEIETEEELELENWMTNSTNFATGLTVVDEIESPMELEDWMTDETNFTGASIYLEVETEETLEVEDWMLETGNFEVENHNTVTKAEKYIFGDNFTLINLDDPKLELEAWMTNNKVWRN